MSFDAAEQRAVVAHGGADIAVSTTLMRTLDYPLGVAVMVIGEIAEPRAPSLVLRARVVASVEGIDYGTYFAAYRVALSAQDVDTTQDRVLWRADALLDS